MSITIAVVAPGAMGSGLARGLTERGAHVLTSLDGRSEATKARARAAGMQDASLDEMAGAELILSVVPPGEAIALAERFVPALGKRGSAATFVDCNAVSPRTKQELAEIVAPTGAAFVDASIIGLPPTPDGKKPALYVSGDASGRTALLKELGVDLRPMPGPIGAAAALKMSYAGITKGTLAIGAAMILAATRVGAAEGLHDELALSQRQMLARFETSIPGMYAKAYRWVAEMREIAAFLGEDEAAAMMFEGAARLYERLAADVAGEGKERSDLDAFLRR